MKKITFLLFLLSTLLATSQNINLTKSGVAAQCYDVTTYFDSTPTKGSIKYSSIYNGAIYYFSSKNNQEKFDANPSKYEPQYGGWCAYAIGNDGSKVSINPKTYKIIEGKLYLFYNKFGINTLKSWNEDEVNLKAKADANWEN